MSDSRSVRTLLSHVRSPSFNRWRFRDCLRSRARRSDSRRTIRRRGDLVLRGLAQRLEQEFNTEQTLFTNKLRVGTGASDEELRRLHGWVDAVVVGVGD